MDAPEVLSILDLGSYLEIDRFLSALAFWNCQNRTPRFNNEQALVIHWKIESVISRKYPAGSSLRLH